jgi:hypothetical protein
VPLTHFLHVRKTGGSAVRYALAPFAASHGIVIHGHKTRLADVPPGDRVFFFVRDPIERFASGFYSRFRRGRPLRDLTWTPSEERAFADFRHAGTLAEALSSPDPSLAERARFAMRGINHVSSSFADWFTIDEIRARRASIVLLGLQERLSSDFAYVTARLGLPDDRLPEDPVLAHRTPPEFDTTLSPLARENLRRWYAADVRFFAEYGRLRGEWFGTVEAQALR